MKTGKITAIILSLSILLGIIMAMAGNLRAENKISASDKLDEILMQQKDILQKIEFIKQELYIIKQNTNRC